MTQEIEEMVGLLQEPKFYVEGITEPAEGGTFQLVRGAAQWIAEHLIQVRQPQPVTEPTFIENLVSPDFLEGVRHGVELEHGEVEAAQQRIVELEGAIQKVVDSKTIASARLTAEQALQPTAAPTEAT